MNDPTRQERLTPVIDPQQFLHAELEKLARDVEVLVREDERQKIIQAAIRKAELLESLNTSGGVQEVEPAADVLREFATQLERGEV